MKRKETDYAMPYSLVVSNDFNNDSKMVLLLIFNSRDFKLSQVTIREKLNMSKYGLEKALRLIQSMGYITMDEYGQIRKTEYGNKVFGYQLQKENKKATSLSVLRKKNLFKEKKYGQTK